MNIQDVTAPVLVRVIKLRLEELSSWRELLEDIPLGCGVKGGIARKILKVCCGLSHADPDFAAEMNGEGDVDILVAVPHVNPRLRLSLREVFAGLEVGGMILEAKDIEVRDNLAEYFLTRDVTMNEALVFRCSDGFYLLYTEEAQRDVHKGVIRPSIHCFQTVFAQNWRYGPNKEVVIGVKPLARCIIRYLKGHGFVYGIDEDTWRYYCEIAPLTPHDLFKIIRFYADDDEKFEICIDHLKDLGLVSWEVDGNFLWGSCLFETNLAIARYGKRLTFSEPSPQKIEEWILMKEANYRRRNERRRTLLARGVDIEPDVSAEVIMPSGWERFPDYFPEIYLSQL